MALTLLESAKLTQNKFFSGIALNLVNTDEMAATIPFQPFQGTAMTYIREGTLPTTAFIPDDGSLPSPSTGTDDVVTVPIRRIGSDLDVDSLADDLSAGRDVGRQVAKKCKATWNLIKDRMVNGGWTTAHMFAQSGGFLTAITGMTYGPGLDSGRFGPGTIKYDNTAKTWAFRGPGDPTYGEPVVATTNGTYTLKGFNASKFINVTLNVASATVDGTSNVTFGSANNEFDGMKRLVAPSMIIPSIGTNGDDFSMTVLDQMLLMEKVRLNRVFIVPGVLTIKLLALLRELGGTDPGHVRLPGYSGATLAYRGIPIIENDNVLADEVKGSSTNLTSIYLASLDADEGLFMGYPSTRTEGLDVEGDPRNTNVMGWRIEDIGPLESKAHRRVRVQWYGALGLRSERALVRAKEIRTT